MGPPYMGPPLGFPDYSTGPLINCRPSLEQQVANYHRVEIPEWCIGAYLESQWLIIMATLDQCWSTLGYSGL